ncbi:MAG: hypothetical protein PGN16_03935 [Sphingomonas phyllosphaerae]|uniref:hypothetical protein n=1 Tax=Sphingomonas phyllosphaerae TaxID=257003 RepID=UPI002FFB47AA
MSGTFGTRPHTGGPARTADRGALIAERERLLAAPASAARTADLRRIRSRLFNLSNRSDCNGA